MLYPISRMYENGPAWLVGYHTITEYRRKVAASTVTCHPVRESSICSFPLYQPILSSIRYIIPTRQADYVLMTRLGSRVSMGNGDHLLSGGAHDPQNCYKISVYISW
ncbi:hypothetical protein EVAR_45568_1 [Eumeta japonica]|uniref:Uncharacterized protein n=1 Tax=Eumeta variegata TaxID=151549 RepID=A0A4C1YVL9_EUMVA|nr:hypothetical protein EVAR_45568_1 [Eumeta japonica]